jgi:hypothetical protein
MLLFCIHHLHPGGIKYNVTVVVVVVNFILTCTEFGPLESVAVHMGVHVVEPSPVSLYWML